MQQRVVKAMTSSFSWSKVRARIWIKAEQLFMQEQLRTMDCDIKPERCELKEGGYFDQAKTLVLREVSQGN
jgi:hypothetical protein